jgi:hypothetical protein
LYHILVPLQIREEEHPLLLGLEPPGNLARDLALYRRSLFSRFGAARGDASAFAFPELSALAFLDPGPASPRPLKVPALRGALESCWDGIEGSFTSSGLFVEDNSLFLGIEGQWEKLHARSIEQ